MERSIAYLYEWSMYSRRVAGFRGQKGQSVMSAKSMEQWVQPVAEKPGEYSRRRLVVVVGFDGSASAYRALDAATATDLGPAREHRGRLCRPLARGCGALGRGDRSNRSRDSMPSSSSSPRRSEAGWTALSRAGVSSAVTAPSLMNFWPPPTRSAVTTAATHDRRHRCRPCHARLPPRRRIGTGGARPSRQVPDRRRAVKGRTHVAGGRRPPMPIVVGKSAKNLHHLAGPVLPH